MPFSWNPKNNILRKCLRNKRRNFDVIYICEYVKIVSKNSKLQYLHIHKHTHIAHKWAATQILQLSKVETENQSKHSMHVTVEAKVTFNLKSKFMYASIYTCMWMPTRKYLTRDENYSYLVRKIIYMYWWIFV